MATYYVSPSGNDSNPGSQSQPWQTLQANVASLVPGDIMNVEAGSYVGFVVGYDTTGTYGIIAGTSGSPIIIQADPNATPGSVIINAKNNKSISGIDLEPGCDYIIIKGFTVDGTGSTITSTVSRGYGIKITGNYDQVLNCTVKHMIGACTAGIHDDAGDYCIISGNECTDIQDSAGSTTGHGIYIANCTGVQVTYNYLHDNTYIGIHNNGDPNTVQGAVLSNNLILRNGQNGISGDGLQNSTIENNVIYDYAEYGICLFMQDASGGALGNKIINNTIYSSSSSGTSGSIRIKDGSTGNIILNNILLDDSNVLYRISADSISGTVSNYNIIPNNAVVQSEDTGENETFSAWQSATSNDAYSFVSNASAIFTNPSGTVFTELSTSPSIGAGTSTDAPSIDILGNARPNSSGQYDIGAYQSETVSAPTVATLSGPTTGIIGVQSTNFTVSLNASAQSGGVVITPYSNIGTDTFPNSTYTIAQGSSTTVFQFTPLTTSGNRNISITTSPSLTYSGSPIVYDASGVSATTATLTGPTLGVLGQVSTVFTVTLNAPAGPGGVVVTPTSSVSTDTFES